MIESGAICNAVLVLVAVVVLKDMLQDRRAEALRRILMACAMIGAFQAALVIIGILELISGDCYMVVDDECQGRASGILVFMLAMSNATYVNVFYFFWRLEAHWSTLEDWIGTETEERPLLKSKVYSEGDIESQIQKVMAGGFKSHGGAEDATSRISKDAHIPKQMVIYKGEVITGQIGRDKLPPSNQKKADLRASSDEEQSPRALHPMNGVNVR